MTWFPTRIYLQIFNLGDLNLISIMIHWPSRDVQIHQNQKIMISHPQLRKIYLFSVGIGSYFVEILMTWFSTRIYLQIFNLAGLDLVFTMGKSRSPDSSKSQKIMIFDLFWPATSQNIFIFSRIRLIFCGNTYDMISNKNLATDF